MSNADTALTQLEMWAAWEKRDPDYDGLFVFGVKTTGVFCRPSCPSRPKPEHLEFFANVGEALRAGYRPCLRCRPELADGQPPEWAARLMDCVSATPEQRITTTEFQKMGVTPETARRWFQRHYGMTFAAWCRGLRLSHAFDELQRGAPLDDVALGHGFESHSGFRAAFARVFRQAPGEARTGDCLRVVLLETPLGPMLAAASCEQVCRLGFVDRREPAATYTELRRDFGLPVVPGENPVLGKLRAELEEYFAGARREFTVPSEQHGTDFQKRVWFELTQLPFGKTASYEEIARRLGTPRAVRAVAQANAANQLCLLVPCHRVIAKDGSLSGYGGGVWRKRLLLQLERGQTIPR